MKLIGHHDLSVIKHKTQEKNKMQADAVKHPVLHKFKTGHLLKKKKIWPTA